MACRRERRDHAVALVRLALDMHEAVSRRPFGGHMLALRIGIIPAPYGIPWAKRVLSNRVRDEGQN